MTKVAMYVQACSNHHSQLFSAGTVIIINAVASPAHYMYYYRSHCYDQGGRVCTGPLGLVSLSHWLLLLPVSLDQQPTR